MEQELKELEREIGIQQPEYDAFRKQLDKVRVKRSKYLSGMIEDIQSCNRRIKELEKQLGETGHELLAAQAAGDNDLVAELNQAVTAANTEIINLRQRIDNYSRVDVNSLIYGELAQLRPLIHEAKKESRRNWKVVRDYQEDLHKQIEVLERKTVLCSILSGQKHSLGDAVGKSVGSLFNTMFNNHSKREELAPAYSQIMGIHQLQPDPLSEEEVQKRLKETLLQYGK